MFTDADWTEINKLKAAYQVGGGTALKKAIDHLAELHPIQFTKVIGAILPDLLREAIRDAMAEAGFTEEDLQVLSAFGRRPAAWNNQRRIESTF